MDLLKKIPALAPWVKAIESATKAEAKAGIAGSFTLKLCKDRSGKWVIPKAEACIGGFVELGWGGPNPADRNSVPNSKGGSGSGASGPSGPISKPPPAKPTTVDPPTPTPAPHFDPNLPVS